MVNEVVSCEFYGVRIEVVGEKCEAGCRFIEEKISRKVPAGQVRGFRIPCVSLVHAQQRCWGLRRFDADFMAWKKKKNRERISILRVVTTEAWKLFFFCLHIYIVWQAPGQFQTMILFPAMKLAMLWNWKQIWLCKEERHKSFLRFFVESFISIFTFFEYNLIGGSSIDYRCDKGEKKTLELGRYLGSIA
jgi:predicted Fe-S protein YdhL (DUF1289 family)